MMRASVLLVTAAVATVVLTACGPAGGGVDQVAASATSTAAPSTSVEVSPAEQVTAVLQEIATSPDPRLCREAYTARGLAQFAGSDDPLAECEQESKAQASPTDATVSDVVVDGTGATGVLTPADGDQQGLAIGFALVQDGGWRVDQVESVSIVDRAVVDAGTTLAVAEFGADLMSPDDLLCVDDRIRAIPDAAVEASYLTTTGSPLIVAEIRHCVGPGDLLAILFLSSYQLEQMGLTQRQAYCVAGLAIPDFDEFTLDDIVTSPQARDQWIDALTAASEYGTDGPACADA